METRGKIVDYQYESDSDNSEGEVYLPPAVIYSDEEQPIPKKQKKIVEKKELPEPKNFCPAPKSAFPNRSGFFIAYRQKSDHTVFCTKEKKKYIKFFDMVSPFKYDCNYEVSLS